MRRKMSHTILKVLFYAVSAILIFISMLCVCAGLVWLGTSGINQLWWFNGVACFILVFSVVMMGFGMCAVGEMSDCFVKIIKSFREYRKNESLRLENGDR